MKLIYSNENQFLVNNAKNILENHNIEVTLKNEFASGAAGVLAPIDTWVELWIINDIDEEKAETILAQALKQQGIRADSEAAKNHQEGVLEALEKNLHGRRFLLPRAKQARNVLELGLKVRKAEVIGWNG